MSKKGRNYNKINLPVAPNILFVGDTVMKRNHNCALTALTVSQHFKPTPKSKEINSKLNVSTHFSRANNDKRFTSMNKSVTPAVFFGDVVNNVWQVNSSVVTRRGHVLAESIYTEARCIACLLCIFSCPTDAIFILSSSKHFTRLWQCWKLDRKRCIVCGQCTAVCPVVAITEKATFDSKFNRTLFVTLL